MTQEHSRKHKHCQKPCEYVQPCECVQPWSETNCEPDAQWCPTVPIKSPLKKVIEPIYTSSEDPAPQWAPNVIVKPPCTCGFTSKHGHGHRYRHGHLKNCWGGCQFLRSRWQDNIQRHVYGTNPFSDTVNSGGIHFQ